MRKNKIKPGMLVSVAAAVDLNGSLMLKELHLREYVLVIAGPHTVLKKIQYLDVDNRENDFVTLLFADGSIGLSWAAQLDFCGPRVNQDSPFDKNGSKP